MIKIQGNIIYIYIYYISVHVTCLFLVNNLRDKANKHTL